MLSADEVKLINLNLKDFPLMAAASAAIKGCNKCPHRNINQHMVLRSTILRLANNPKFKQFIRHNFKCPVTLGGNVFV